MQEIFERMVELGIRPYNLHDTVYKYRTFEQAVEIIETNKIWYATGEQLRDKDTFELTPQLLNSISSAQTKYYVQNILDLPFNDVTPEELFNGIVNWFQNQVGIFCVGKSPVNTGLWNCFGDNQNGICFGFKIARAFQGHLGFNVKYIKDISSTKKSNIFNNEENDVGNYEIFGWLCTKLEKYTFEDEIRILDFTGFGGKQFEKRSMVEVIYGAGISQEKQDYITTLLNKHHYGVRIGRLDLVK